MTAPAYADFLAAKAQLATASGLDVDPAEVHPALKPHQRDAVVWAVRGGRRAVFVEAAARQATVPTLFDLIDGGVPAEAPTCAGCHRSAADVGPLRQYVSGVWCEACATAALEAR